VVPLPWITVREDGAAESVKSGEELTTRVIVVLWTIVPLVPVTVMVELPGGVDVDVVTVIVEFPEPFTEVGLKLALAPDGRPDALKVMVPANPFTALAVAV
jgi:hypothetical protein